MRNIRWEVSDCVSDKVCVGCIKQVRSKDHIKYFKATALSVWVVRNLLDAKVGVL